ncbi:DUF883 domain-containing protein [Pseudooceanicola sediminis]|uniref:DUF883 domain-containing protein n=1 Tax=Pseudooceanicola sediminis TaxID=2211117 RepID=A0A399J7P9_9RHOB|nr:DUF883 family protein [Pseudooceanicola sediminis]KAA2313955.1 DUF883 domain-containing protein [Puniceibacterium sp. HSS470]RII38766.1 DUF883 domain-containing protein [Pseudooceanicola sediminis]|tara:strand:- start:84618 stop:84977 length:360 start_codon:yes stop_codon:yes gene_type:complete
MAQPTTATGAKPTTTSDAKKDSPDTAVIQAQLEAVQKDVAELTRALTEYGKAQGAHLSGAARAKAEQVRGEAEAGLAYADAQARQAYATAEDRVRENPAASVAIASGVGFLIGLLMARR